MTFKDTSNTLAYDLALSYFILLNSKWIFVQEVDFGNSVYP